MYTYLLLALPALLVAQKGGGSDYDRNSRNNANPANTVSCVLESDKSGTYRPACQGETIKCKQDEDCVIECLGRSDRCGTRDDDCKPCAGTTFIGAGGHDLTFTCEGDAACQGVQIECPERGDCNVRLSGGNGNAAKGMKDAVILGATKGKLTVENNQRELGMAGAQITCPEGGECVISASAAYDTTSESAFKQATIDGSAADSLYLDAEDATRPFTNANVYCPPRQKNRAPSCEVDVSGGEGMLEELRLHVADSLEDVIIRCAYSDEDTADLECFGTAGGYDADPEKQPTLECNLRGSARNGLGGNLDFDCLLTLDTAGYDSFRCLNFEGDDVCLKGGDGGVCVWDEDADNYDDQFNEDRAGSKCSRQSSESSCNAAADCVWQSSADASHAAARSQAKSQAQAQANSANSFVAAAAVQVGDAVASNSWYFAAVALFGSSAAVYYCACLGASATAKQFESARLSFDDE